MLVEKIGKDEKRIRSIWLDTSLIVRKDSGQGLFSCCAGLSVVRPNWCWSGTYITEETVWYLSGYHQYNSLAISLSSFLFLLFFLSLCQKKEKKMTVVPIILQFYSPGYPRELFHFIASKMPNHQLAWDVGTGDGQAAATVISSPLSLSLSPGQIPFDCPHPRQWINCKNHARMSCTQACWSIRC